MRTALACFAFLLSLACLAYLCVFLVELVLEFGKADVTDPIIAVRMIDWDLWLYMACLTAGCLIFLGIGLSILSRRRLPA
jgi:hypothetical protein